jgi:phosphoenolpyruvate carboxykinase (GTP)
MKEAVGHRSLSMPGGLQVSSLSPRIQEYIKEHVKVCQPDSVYVCDGSDVENQALLSKLEAAGRIRKLEKYDNW